MRSVRYLLPLLLLATALPALASKPGYREYSQVSGAVMKGSADPSIGASLQLWVPYHGQTAGAGGAGTRVKICVYQLQLKFLNSTDLAANRPPALWRDIARPLLQKIKEPGEAECNKLVPVASISAKAEQMLRDFEAARLASLRDGCRTTRVQLTKLAGLGSVDCDADSLEQLESHLTAKIDEARTALVEKWAAYGRPAGLPDLTGKEPGDAVESLVAGVAANRSQRDDLWKSQLSARENAVGQVPSAARGQLGNAPSKPADLTDWGFWSALKSVENEVATIAAMGKDYEENRRKLLADLDALATETGRCNGLRVLCDAGWARGACDDGAASRLRSECAGAALAGRETAGPQKIQAAIDARTYLAAGRNWSQALDQLRRRLSSRADAAKAACDEQPQVLAAMNGAVGSLASAGVTDGQKFSAASSAILRCQQGAAFDYQDLADAMELLIARDAGCGSPLTARKAELDRTAVAITQRGTSAQKSALLDQGTKALGEALTCVEGKLRQLHDAARQDMERLQGRYTLAASWMKAVDSDARYAPLRERIAQATPSADDGGFACAWSGAVSAGGATPAVEEFLGRPGCAAARGGGPGGDSCGLLVVAAVAAAGPDFAQGRWGAAEQRFEQVSQACGDEAAALGERQRRLLEYFSAYVKWKQNESFDRQVSRLNYDPAFDKELSGVTQ